MAREIDGRIRGCFLKKSRFRRFIYVVDTKKSFCLFLGVDGFFATSFNFLFFALLLVDGEKRGSAHLFLHLLSRHNARYQMACGNEHEAALVNARMDRHLRFWSNKSSFCVVPSVDSLTLQIDADEGAISVLSGEDAHILDSLRSWSSMTTRRPVISFEMRFCDFGDNGTTSCFLRVLQPRLRNCDKVVTVGGSLASSLITSQDPESVYQKVVDAIRQMCATKSEVQLGPDMHCAFPARAYTFMEATSAFARQVFEKRTFRFMSSVAFKA